VLKTHTMSPLTLLLVAMAYALFGEATATDSVVKVNCCMLLSRLHYFVAFETDTQAPTCDPSTCNHSRLLQLFQKETNTHVSTDISSPDIQFTMKSIDDEMFADIMVWAFIGRHYTANMEGDHTHFVFNPATQIMAAKTPKCEFQKPVYTILLFISIMLLIFSLVLQNLKHIEQDREKTAIMPTESRNAPSLLDFAPRRKLVGGQFYATPPFAI